MFHFCTMVRHSVLFKINGAKFSIWVFPDVLTGFTSSGLRFGILVPSGSVVGPPEGDVGLSLLGHEATTSLYERTTTGARCEGLPRPKAGRCRGGKGFRRGLDRAG
jgi:hypothetical protein